MKFFEWICHLVFSIASLWDRSYDDLLNEHRAFERKILIYTVMAVILMLAATLITPSVEMQPSDGIKFVPYLMHKYIGICALLIGTYSAFASLWNIAGLFYFRYINGITNDT